MTISHKTQFSTKNNIIFSNCVMCVHLLNGTIHIKKKYAKTRLWSVCNMMTSKNNYILSGVSMNKIIYVYRFICT